MNTRTTRTDAAGDNEMVDMGYHYPARFPTPTPTGLVPALPTFRPTPSPIPTRSSGVLPKPINTSIPDNHLSVEIDMPIRVFPGTPFRVTGILSNNWKSLENKSVFSMIQITDAYWFWPGWTFFSNGTGNIDYREMTIPLGHTVIDVIPYMVWPDTGDMEMHLAFWGATWISIRCQ